MALLEFEKPLYELERSIEELRSAAGTGVTSLDDKIEALQMEARKLRKEIFGDLTRWQRVQLSRHPDRPYSLDYISRMTESFIELHGDRAFADDPSIVGGLARLGGRAVVIIGHQKGRGTRDAVRRNFGMPHPEGYRKARRLFEMAEKFGRPVVTLIDTTGAYPGIGAEERGQSEAIGQSLLTMSELTVPVVAVVIGEGGSGGALALGVANRVYMLEYATYSVISPEGCASILWKDGSRAAEAAEALRVTAPDIKALGVVDGLIDEPDGGAHRDHDRAAKRVRDVIVQALESLSRKSPEQLRASRYAKFRAMGQMHEVLANRATQ